MKKPKCLPAGKIKSCVLHYLRMFALFELFLFSTKHFVEVIWMPFNFFSA